MAQSPSPSVENNFSKGFLTEYTGLNFPENAVTAATNCVFERIGDVHRRPGIDIELNGVFQQIDRSSRAVNTYVWKNAGGDGQTQVLVEQVGSNLWFYKSSAATIAAPLSTTLIGSVDMTPFLAPGASFDITKEVTFADGNGFLFVFHTNCNPFYLTYVFGPPDSVFGTGIIVMIRDLTGIDETGVPDDNRPSQLSTEHQYNLFNQGWTFGSGWNASIASSGYTLGTGSKTFTVNSSTGTAPVNGNTLVITFTCTAFFAGLGNWAYRATMTGTVTSISLTGGAGTVTVSVSSFTENVPGSLTQNGQNVGTNPNYSNKNTTAALSNLGFVSSWFNAVGNYPSNADIWYEYKNTSGAFAPGTTIANVVPAQAPAPKGHVLIQAFDQSRSGSSGIPGVTDVLTMSRPTIGAWFQGRVWYTGVNASQPATGDMQYTTWTENIYFSQIIEKTSQFGYCYQRNDPTDENFFDLLPSDGGVIVIQGSGAIFKLFPIQNGILVFAANGVWFITGSSGIGFTANDYTISKISAIQSFSPTSFVDVRGNPYWWNDEGIYTVAPGQGSEGLQYGAPRGAAYSPGLKVESITFTTIQSFYQDIPLSSRKNARGAYDPLNWIVRWLYKSTESININDTYSFDRVLVFNTATGAFYNWTLPPSVSGPGFPSTTVNGIAYIQSPGGSTAPEPTIKYMTSAFGFASGSILSFAEENDTTTYSDFSSSCLVSGNIVGNVLTVSGFGNSSTFTLDIGTIISGVGIPLGTKIIGFLSGHGFTGAYTLNTPNSFVSSGVLLKAGTNFTSSFESGFKLKGAAQRRFQNEYIYLYLNNIANPSYRFQGVWEYAINPNSGKYTNLERTDITDSINNFGIVRRRHKIRGRGLVLQFRAQSVDGLPFDFIGWSIDDKVNQGV